VKTDFHLHTHLCRHAAGGMEEYVRQALALGLEHICFTDHVPLPYDFDLTHRMGPEQLSDYIAGVRELQRRYRGRIEIGLGLECDYLPGVEPWLERILAEQEWDCVLGSIHFVGHIRSDAPVFVFRPGEVPLDQLEDNYWRQLDELVTCGLFDAITHLDIFKKRGWRPQPERLPRITGILDRMAAAGTALEVNASGYDKPEVGEAYPHPQLLRLAVERGLTFIYGSDAHQPQQVGRYRDVIQSQLLRLGVEQHAIYRRRQRFLLPLTADGCE